MKISIIELFFRMIPESFLFIYATFVFSKKSMRLRPFIFSSILLGISTYCIRSLPIHSGINNILSIAVFIILSTKVNRIDLVRSIKVVFMSTMLGFMGEGINVLLIKYVFKQDINFIFNDSKMKILYGIPSLLIYGLILFIVLFFRKMQSKKKKLETTSV
jgi:hypothetical protein